jgi:hypothetical protein
MPFYQEPFDNALRFGDVIHGFVSSIPKFDTPSVKNEHLPYLLELTMPEFCVILSPCCSIGESTLTLAPLEGINRNFLTNPYFREDLTNINRKVPPDKTVSPEKWNELSSEKKQEILDEGSVFSFVELFIYGENPLLPKYNIRIRGGEEFELGFYVIDFRRTFRITCQRIQSPTNSPLESKILQLTIQTRQELREKISFYYSRLPKEDLIQQAALS